MQNRYCAADEAGYVALNGGWRCSRCGCANQGCDCCSQCGWNRMGCQGGVVCANQTPRENDCCAEQTVRCGCSAQANGRQNGQSVHSCPANTYLRGGAAEAAGCGCQADQSSHCTCGEARRTEKCGCQADQSSRCACGEARRTETCGCQAAQNRTDSCDCAANSPQVRACACGGGRTAADTARGVNAGVGMVYAVEQQLDQIYQSESALRAGTLFPELHKPLNGYCPGSCNCATTGQQSDFAAWELRLYLDTHPDDQQAQELFSRLCVEVEDPSYATAFLTGGSCGTQWDWTNDPWPWECGPCGM